EESAEPSAVSREESRDDLQCRGWPPDPRAPRARSPPQAPPVSRSGLQEELEEPQGWKMNRPGETPPVQAARLPADGWAPVRLWRSPAAPAREEGSRRRR